MISEALLHTMDSYSGLDISFSIPVDSGELFFYLLSKFRNK